jgi:dethiobiotin synthetase
MTRKPDRGLFITGTDTSVGKTYVAAGIARALHVAGYRVGIYKPAASGCPQRGTQLYVEDADQLWRAAGRPQDIASVCPQAFAAPLAPHLAARAEGREIDEPLLFDGISAWSDYDLVLVEGAGGLMSPMSDHLYVADLAARFRLPLVIVAANGIGVINQTLQTVMTAAAYQGGLPIAGLVLNDGPEHSADPSRDSNLAEIQARCESKILAHVTRGGADALADVDWFALAKASTE